MYAPTKATLYQNFHSTFGADLRSKKLSGSAVLQWVRTDRKARTCEPADLYRVAQELSRHTYPKLPTRYWFYSLRFACGLRPVQLTARYEQWLGQQPQFAPLFGSPFSILPTVRFDLSRTARTVRYAGRPDQLADFNHEIAELLQQSDAIIGYGGYGEVRDFYRWESYGDFPEDGLTRRVRDMHLGTDFWTTAGTPVFAPLDGTVYARIPAGPFRGYGPSVVLFHRPFPGFHFYTSYGHLSAASVERLRSGQRIRAGRLIGKLGTPDENGGWPAHLHFQVHVDMLGSKELLGVGYSTERPLWMDLCPNGEELLR